MNAPLEIVMVSLGQDWGGAALRWIAILFSCLGMVFFALPLQAATYYLSATSGEDSRTATEAQNLATPWRSLSKIEKLALGPGDQVLLERGGQYPGTLNLGKGAEVAGAAGNAVTVGAYGNGTVPELTGVRRISGAWTQHQGNIWVTSVTDSVVQLFLDGKTLTLARYPNKGTAPVTSLVSTQSFVCAALVGMDLAGATVFVRSQHWTWNTNRIESVEGASGTILFSGSPIYPVQEKWGAWVNNHLTLLDAPGEWYFDATAGRLYAWLPENANPNGRVLEASVPGHGIALNNVRHAILQDLGLRGHGGDGINGSGNDLVLRRLRVENPMGSGLRIKGSRLTVEENEVVGPNVHGMMITGDANRIENNTVKRVAEISRLTRTGLGGECCSGRGMQISGNDVVIRGNTLDSIGYIGIGFSGQRNLIESNLIRRFCMTTDDGSAIYTWSSDYNLPGSAGSVIRKNLVLDAIGAPDGIPDLSTFALGIYLDDRTHHIVIEGNTVSGADIGIFLHNSRDDTVRNNLCYGNRKGQFIAQRDNIVGLEDMYGNVARGNTLYSKLKNEVPYIERGHLPTASHLLVSRQDDLECRETPTGVRCDRNGKLAWERSPSLALSDTAGKALATYDFSTSIQQWTAWPTPPVAVMHDASLRGGSLRVEYPGDTANRSPLLTVPKHFPVQIGQKYLMRFSARAATPFEITVIARKSNGSYANLAPTQSFRIDTTWSDYLHYFEITASDLTCRIDFGWEMDSAKFWIDDAALYPLPLGDTTLGPHSALYAATGGTEFTVNPSPGNTWLDVQGKTRNGPVTLQAFEALVAIRDQRGLALPLRIRSASPIDAHRHMRILKPYPVLTFPESQDGSASKSRDARGRQIHPRNGLPNP